MPGFSEYITSYTTLLECADEKEGMLSLKAFQGVINEFVASPEKFGCPLPCERTMFTYDVIDTHQNSVILQEPEILAEEEDAPYIFYFFYKTFLVEQRVETLIYDFGGFLAAAGGNLGLCLGFSLLSILFNFTQLLISGLQQLNLNLNKE